MFGILAFAVALYVVVKLIPVGFSKFDAEKSAATFTSLGGDTVRYIVGFAEIFGSVFLLSPTTALFGLFLVTPVMLGAIYLHVKVWGNSPKDAALVLALAVLSNILWIL
jgi:uncharacterized membrane protein YphA (DoxX/SURF4 family)